MENKLEIPYVASCKNPNFMKKPFFVILSILALVMPVLAQNASWGPWTSLGHDISVRVSSIIPGSGGGVTWQFRNDGAVAITFMDYYYFDAAGKHYDSYPGTMNPGQGIGGWAAFGPSSGANVSFQLKTVTPANSTSASGGSTGASQQNTANQQAAIQAALQRQAQLQQQIQQQQEAAQEQERELQQQIAEKRAAFQVQQATLNAKQQQILNNYNAKMQNLQTIQNAGENAINAIGMVLQQQEADREAEEAKQEMERQQNELEEQQREAEQELDNLQAQLQEAQREASLTPEQRAEEERQREEQQAEAQRQAELQRQQQIEQQRQEAAAAAQQAEQERQQMLAAIPNFAGTWELDLPKSERAGQLKLWFTDSGMLAGSGEFKFKMRQVTQTDTDIDRYACKIDVEMGTNNTDINNGQMIVSSGFPGNYQDHHSHRNNYFIHDGSFGAFICNFFLLCDTPIVLPVELLMIHRSHTTFDGQLIFSANGELYLGENGQRIIQLKKVSDVAQATAKP